MLRKLFSIAVVLGVLGLAVFWFVTAPATVPASALGAHAPTPANGKEMFYAGGCSSCHATPGQDDKTRLGGGLGLKSPFGTFYVPNISPDPNDGIGKFGGGVGDPDVFAMPRRESLCAFRRGDHGFPGSPRFQNLETSAPSRAHGNDGHRTGPKIRISLLHFAQ